MALRSVDELQRVVERHLTLTMGIEAMGDTELGVAVTRPLISWISLLSGYLAAALACAVRVRRDQQAAAPPASAGDGSSQEGNDAASGDNTRTQFYQHLFVALSSRAICIPLEVCFHPMQLVAETLPYLTFASSWALLVSFLVHLTGASSGNETYSKPQTILVAAFGIYVCLILAELWNQRASDLLYGVLGFIYACLCAVLLIFGPRLITLLQPRLALALRLIACCAICLFAFSARAVCLFRQIVAPPENVLWWWKYGALELLPSAVLLFIMHPNRSQPVNSKSGAGSTIPSGGGVTKKPEGEVAPLFKQTVTYGT